MRQITRFVDVQQTANGSLFLTRFNQYGVMFEVSSDFEIIRALAISEFKKEFACNQFRNKGLIVSKERLQATLDRCHEMLNDVDTSDNWKS